MSIIYDWLSIHLIPSRYRKPGSQIIKGDNHEFAFAITSAMVMHQISSVQLVVAACTVTLLIAKLISLRSALKSLRWGFLYFTAIGRS